MLKSPDGASVALVRLQFRSITVEMDPYTKPNERRVGAARPKISHTGSAVDTRTPEERKKQKEEVLAERRAMKKAARRHLKKQLLDELEEGQ